jgi:4-hydroxythreonine-4-phosphate dehydrogenase
VDPRIVVTPGDPRGIGPEVAAKALEVLRSEDFRAELIPVGPEGPTTREALARQVEGARRDMDDAVAGSFAARSIERAVEMAQKGDAHGIVTAPLHKPSLHAAGWRVPGQTEMLRDLSGAPSVGMFMVSEKSRLDAPLRVLLATTHLPLRLVPDRLTSALLSEQIGLANQALARDWAIGVPRLALCGLNPHASDGGLFGDEEARLFRPAVEEARSAGVTVEGPLPADTVFLRALEGEFDAVIAPYHDVGMAVFKTVSFGAGVNVTIGLPFIRTSPDHGTAFDIAGTNRARATSMIEAVRLACTLSKNRFDMDSAGV